MGHSMKRINSVTKEYTTNVTFPFDQNRSYFMIVVTSGTAAIGFGGGAKIPLAVGDHYAPYVCPISEIDITVSGAIIVHSDTQVQV